MIGTIRAIPVALAFALAAWPVCAHHSVLAFDNDHGRVIAGVVTEIRLAYPHSRIVVAVGECESSRRVWLVEAEGAAVLEGLGWHGESVAAGDYVTVHGAPAKDGRSELRCRTLTLADGSQLACFPGATQPPGG